MIVKLYRLCCLLLLLPVLAGAQSVRVVASIEPLAMVARDLAGDGMEVATLMRPGQGLHQASLSPDQVRQLRRADLFVWLGAAAEPQLAPLVEKRSGPDLALLSLEGIHRLHGADGHGHDGHDHGETALDPHLWLDPENMTRLAEALAEQLDLPANDFRQRLTAKRNQVEARLAPRRERRYVSYHDPWAYFAEAFSLRRALTISTAVEGGASARRLVSLGRTMEQEGVKCVLAEPEARRALLEKLCNGECRLVPLDPLGRDRAGTGYIDFLDHLGERFSHCLGGS